MYYSCVGSLPKPRFRLIDDDEKRKTNAAEYVVDRNGRTSAPPALMGTASCKCINKLKFQRNWDDRLIRSRNKTAPEDPLEAAVLCGESLGVMLASREKSGQASDPTFVRGKLVDKNGRCYSS